ncbi:MAG: glycosyl hydrolase 115 family protein [Lachnospiraceae bacterium]|nr:glycosyl hydrolase 115 family protein [Lachnospiraceae bacterium]
MFVFNKNTKIVTQLYTKPVRNAIAMLERDRDKVFEPTEECGREIVLVQGAVAAQKDSMVRCEAGVTVSELAEDCDEERAVDTPASTDNLREYYLAQERYRIEICEGRITITAGGELGFVYALLYLSEHHLGILPFWFWMDQSIETKKQVEIPEGVICSKDPVVVFRGWFFNDEVLMLKWKYNRNGIDGWKMCFEALLRCGGNMTIPGTDKESRKNRQLAADYGLWITHHHAEPLGAEMFARAYPEINPNYMEHPKLFHALWEEAVKEQQGCKVVWNLCFRGQGDAPFWSSDTTGAFDTPKKRGKMISDMIRRQCEVVKQYEEHPVFCTNLYGEIMELYEQGHMELAPDIIKVRADNGFGKMVTRRRDNHPGRTPAMPNPKDGSAQGIYYHVSFYDLQAANHITMLPNSVDFVNRELGTVLECGGGFFWVINCSNVRPHVYYLDAVRKKWMGEEVSDASHSKEFVRDYFGGDSEIAGCYEVYPKAMVQYGTHEDEHAGEQFYTENIRLLAHQLLVDREQPARALRWLTGEVSLQEQVRKLAAACRSGAGELEALMHRCEAVFARLEREEDTEARKSGDMSGVQGQIALLRATLALHIKLHYLCRQGVQCFEKACEALFAKDYERAFVLFGDSAEWFEQGEQSLRAAEYGIWEDFYLNDCFADLKHTAYMVRKVMGLARELGDNARHDAWYRKYCYAPEDRNIYLLLVLDNHMTDEELYQVMKERVER